MAFVTALVVSLVALASAPGHAFYFDVTPKIAVLLVGTAVLLILAARRAASPSARRILTVLLLLNTASLALSTGLSANRLLSLHGSSWRCFGAFAQGAAMLFAWLVARQTSVRTVLWAIAISAVPAARYGTLGDARSLAVWLLGSVFLTIALASTETRRGWKIAARLAGVLAIAALIVTCARNAPWQGAHRLLWRDTLAMAAHRPLTGYGPEVFLAEFPPFESKALAKASPEPIYESPRNAFLDVLVAQGVPGLLLLCGLCAAGLAAAWKRREFWLAGALGAQIAGLQFASLILPTAILLLATIAIAVRPTYKCDAPRPTPVLRAVAPFLVLAILYFALRVTMADHELFLTRRLLDDRDFVAATAQYETYWFWHLPGANADVWYSRSWMEVARSTTDPDIRTQALTIAEEAASRATQHAEEPFLAWYNLAQIAIFERHFEDGEQDLRRSISTHPNWSLPHRLLAQDLESQSRTDEAQEEFANAVEIEHR